MLAHTGHQITGGEGGAVRDKHVPAVAMVCEPRRRGIEVRGKALPVVAIPRAPFGCWWPGNGPHRLVPARTLPNRTTAGRARPTHPHRRLGAGGLGGAR